eukprot:jgi/Chrzof1/8271/Cz03g04010.t1
MTKDSVCQLGSIEHLDDVVANNIAMAKETEGLLLPPDVITKGVRAVLEGSANSTYYIIEQDGVVVAQLMITYEWSDWRASNVWWIQSVYVPPQHRQKGLFKCLYEHVKAEAQRAGAAGLRLYADTHNVKAQATYEKLGMTSHYKVYEDMFTGY